MKKEYLTADESYSLLCECAQCGFRGDVLMPKGLPLSRRVCPQCQVPRATLRKVEKRIGDWVRRWIR